MTTFETRRVTFDADGQTLVGTLLVPAAPGPHPAVIVTGSWLTVKEQMPAIYAPRLAAAGYAALTFDFTGFGESGGQPRDVESARQKVRDLRAAVGFLRGLPDIDAARIGLLPICATAGYAAMMIADGDPGVASIAMVAPWLHDAAIARAIYGGDDGVAARLDAARAARARYDATGEVEYIPAASNHDPRAAMYWEGDALDYYLSPRRGGIPAWGARFAVMAWTEWLGLDPIAVAPAVTLPTRVVTGPGTATAGGAAAFAAALGGRHDVVEIPGSQFDFYDDPATVDRAVAAAVAHFRETL
jgi:dienelactone hydrolase